MDSICSNILVAVLIYDGRDKILACRSSLLGNEDVPFKVFLLDSRCQAGDIVEIWGPMSSNFAAFVPS